MIVLLDIRVLLKIIYGRKLWLNCVKLEIKAGKIPRKKIFDAEVIYSFNGEREKGVRSGDR